MEESGLFISEKSQRVFLEECLERRDRKYLWPLLTSLPKVTCLPFLYPGFIPFPSQLKATF